MNGEMKDKDMAVQSALAVKAKYLAHIKGHLNVTGVGVGYKVVNGKRTDIVSVRVYVSKKVSKQDLKKEDILPSSLDGILLDVIEVSPKAHSEFTSRHNPMLGGISIGNEVLGGSGTITYSVFDNILGEDMILSNWHVLCGRFTCANGEVIIQPGTGGGDGGQPQDKVARLYRSVLSNEVDAAIGRLTGERFLIREILELGGVNGVGDPALGMQVRKAGRTTGVTSATITDISADITVDYDTFSHELINQLVIEGDNASKPGDSGSLWMDDQNMAIGLNFAGQEGGGTAFANKFKSVLSAMNINLNNGITMQDFVAISFLELL